MEAEQLQWKDVKGKAGSLLFALGVIILLVLLPSGILERFVRWCL